MILIIEDNHDINKMLSDALNNAGFKTQSAYDGIEGSKMLKDNSYALILLDIMLPYKSGDQILKELREYSQVPVIVLSAKDMVGTKIDMLKLGADDYVTKPFDINEVVARVETNLRRVQITEKENRIYTHKDIVLDEDAKRVTVNSKELTLTEKEYEILELMIKNSSRIFTKAYLYETIWNEDYLGDDNTIKVHLSKLRNKLNNASPGNEYIETVWGLGYRLKS